MWKGHELDHSEILKALKVQPITKLSDKGSSAVFKVSGEDGTVFVLRIYDREPVAYKMLEGEDIPGIPKVFACRFIQGRFCVEEEYIDGVSLQEMIDGGARMEEERARELILTLCSTLSNLHARGIIHRDIKPEHIMLTAEGKLYLIDLDAAMRLIPEKTSDTRLLGTAVYAAPEQFGLKRSDVRTDIFAVGILLNIVLTGVHPAVQQYARDDLGKVIAKCTEMNPACRYQDDEALISDLEQAVLSEQKAQRLKKRKIAAGAIGVAILILGILLFDILYYPTVVNDYVFPSDSNCIICTKESGNTYRPLESEFTESTSSETPAQLFLGESRNMTFYVLNRNKAKKLTLPLLDFYLEETGDMLEADISETGTVKIGNVEYHIWKVKLAKDFEGAARIGIAFDGELTQYNYAGEEDTEKTKFLWVLDENYEEENFLTEHDGNVIPCGENVSGQKFNSTGGLSNSELLLGAGDEENDPLTKDINLSLAPGDEANAFYIVHPKGTVLKSQSYGLWAFGLNSSGYVGEGSGEMVASGWRYGMTGAAVKGSENRSMIDTLLCVAVQKEKYAEAFRFDNLGSGNRHNLEEFLKAKDKNGNTRKVRKCVEYTSYTIYLDPADDAAENEIVFQLKRTAH